MDMSNLLPPAFMDEFGRGDLLSIRNGRGDKVADFDLKGAGKAREMVRRVCRMRSRVTGMGMPYHATFFFAAYCIIRFVCLARRRRNVRGRLSAVRGPVQYRRDIVDCIEAKTKVWDERLNKAYKNLPQRLDAGQLGPLKEAQRLWVKFRDANCGFYGSQEGTIRQIQAAECMRSMTKDRALELENVMKFD